MKKLITNNRREVIGVVIGAIAGWLYWRFVGCTSGGCMITSSPVISTLYGAAMGFFVSGTFKKSKSANASKPITPNEKVLPE